MVPLSPPQKLLLALPSLKYFHQGNAAKLVNFAAHESVIQEAIQELFIDGSKEILLDSSPNSLQWRTLTYLEKKRWIKEPKLLLKKAWLSAKKANAAETKKFFLGTETEKSLKQKRGGFSRREQLLCSQAAIIGSFSTPFTAHDFAEFVERQFKAGNGLELLDFLKRLSVNHADRKSSGFNPQTLVMSLLWTADWAPLWILPGRAIAEVVRLGLDEKKSRSSASINTAVRAAKLVRLPSIDVKKFYSHKVDAEGKSLHREISENTGFDISCCFRGASPAI